MSTQRSLLYCILCLGVGFLTGAAVAFNWETYSGRQNLMYAEVMTAAGTLNDVRNAIASLEKGDQAAALQAMATIRQNASETLERWKPEMREHQLNDYRQVTAPRDGALSAVLHPTRPKSAVVRRS